MSRVLPSVTDLTSLLSSLTGRAVHLKATPPYVFANDKAALVAAYTTDDGVLGATLVSDLTFAASAGAALTMISAEVVMECAADGEMTERILENAHEVLNVAATLFNQPGSSHLVLGQVAGAGSELPAPLAQLLAKPGHRMDLEGMIEGYPKGRLSILLP